MVLAEDQEVIQALGPHALHPAVYDNTNQLTDDAVKSYAYDSNGNRTMTGYATTTGNRMTNDGVYTYTYDNAGNVTKKSKGASAETWTYTWDGRNQLIGVEERATDGGTLQMKATYVNDVWGNRIERMCGTGQRLPQNGMCRTARRSPWIIGAIPIRS